MESRVPEVSMTIYWFRKRPPLVLYGLGVIRQRSSAKQNPAPFIRREIVRIFLRSDATLRAPIFSWLSIHVLRREEQMVCRRSPTVYAHPTNLAPQQNAEWIIHAIKQNATEYHGVVLRCLLNRLLFVLML